MEYIHNRATRDTWFARCVNVYVGIWRYEISGPGGIARGHSSLNSYSATIEEDFKCCMVLV